MTTRTAKGGLLTRRMLIAMVAMGIIALALGYFTHPVYAATKVTICHATSGSNEFVVITIDEGASAFPHLDDNGSPLNGHEDDFLLPGTATVEDCQEAAHSPSPSPSESASAAESIAESEAASAEQSVEASGEQSVEAGTGTPAESVSNGALSLNGVGPLPTIAFSLILLASLGALAYANVKSARNIS